MKENSKFFRFCPFCNDYIEYKFNCHYKRALEKNLTCGSKLCESKRKSLSMMGDKNPMFNKIREQNPFFNKKHTDESKELIRTAHNNNKHIYQSDDFKLKMSNVTSGNKNGMFGKNFYNQWVLHHGEDIAISKMKEFKEKQSKNNTGNNNSMFGKPSPIGSGIGISGWYNGHYFRSILELTYMVKIIDRFNLNWVSAESNKFKIEYKDINGNSKNYFADFIINNKYIIECKPKKLINTNNNILKQEAAKEYCNKNGMIYKIFSTSFIKKQEFVYMVETGKIILTKKWKLKYEQNKIKYS